MEGTVKWFNTKKGYGFIAGEDGEEYFVHYTAVPREIRLRDNDRVSFEPADGDRGKQAQNIKLLQKGSEIAAAHEEAPVEESQAEEPAQEETTPVEESQTEEPAQEETTPVEESQTEEPAQEEKKEE